MKFTLRNIASYGDSPIDISFAERINIIYGINGAGKTVISNYLYDISQPPPALDDEDIDIDPDPLSKYYDCKKPNIDPNEIAVYNTKFSLDNFYEKHDDDGLRAIFGFAQKNKSLEKQITKLGVELQDIEEKLEKAKGQKQSAEDDKNTNRNHAVEEIWSIKDEHDDSSKNKELDFCLAGLKSKKLSLFEYLLNTELITKSLDYDINKLKEEAKPLDSENADKIDEIITIEEHLNNINLEDHSVNKIKIYEIEKDSIFKESIKGKESNTLYKIIQEYGNPDWVRDGKVYLPKKESLSNDDKKDCPFCQEPTITKTLIEKLDDYFEGDYENKINALKAHLSEYGNFLESLKSYSEENIPEEINQFIKDDEFSKAMNDLIDFVEKNKKVIENKIDKPSKNIELKDTNAEFQKVEDVISKINTRIIAHNEKIANKENVKEEIKNKFWKLMRKEKNKIIVNYSKRERKLIKDIGTYDGTIKKLVANITLKKEEIEKLEKNTVNTNEAINNINKLLCDIGLDNLLIEKYGDDNDNNSYKIKRIIGDNDATEDVDYLTLSEGEKTIISFLYFLQVCKGKFSDDGAKKKYIVIDDPISSLSHNFVYNLSQWIKKYIIKDNAYEQIIILTHNLYFFHEIIKINTKFDEDPEYKCFRIIKNKYSQIQKMEYDEIKNEYESYWQIIKDYKKNKDLNPILLANTMRNILEYFFGFIKNKEHISSILSGMEESAFSRYIDRESHYDSINIYDAKSIDIDDFLDKFHEVFKKAKHEEHYKRMMK